MRQQQILRSTSQAVLPLGGILRRKCGCGQHTVAGGNCSECEKTKGVMQRKPSNGDQSLSSIMMKDRETSQTRISTLRRTNGVLQRKCACGQHTAAGGGCSACEKNNELQRKSISGDPVNTVPPSIDDALRSAGEPLDESTRTFMERRFGHDFTRDRRNRLATI